MNWNYGPHDFEEDAEHENGNYQCQCLTCKEFFVGYKRRLRCKLCEKAYEDERVD